MIRIPSHRPPTHPGEVLLEDFIAPMGLTQRQLADAIHVPYQRVNEVVNQRRCVGICSPYVPHNFAKTCTILQSWSVFLMPA